MNVLTMWKCRRIFNCCQAIYANKGFCGTDIYEDDLITVIVREEYLPGISKSGKGYDFWVYLREGSSKELVYCYYAYHAQGNTGWEDRLKKVAKKCRRELAEKEALWKLLKKEQRERDYAPL